MSADLAAAVATLLQSVRGGRGALLMDLDGVPIEQATAEPELNAEALAAEYAGLLRHAQSAAAGLRWGAVRSLSVRGAASLVVFRIVSGELALGAETGPTDSRGQTRQAIEEAASQLGDI